MEPPWKEGNPGVGVANTGREGQKCHHERAVSCCLLPPLLETGAKDQGPQAGQHGLPVPLMPHCSLEDKLQAGMAPGKCGRDPPVLEIWHCAHVNQLEVMSPTGKILRPHISLSQEAKHFRLKYVNVSCCNSDSKVSLSKKSTFFLKSVSSRFFLMRVYVC